MSNTTYFKIPLPGENSRDWVTLLNEALSRLTEVIVRTQLPAGTTLRWGNIAGGAYLEVSAEAGVVVKGGLDHGTQPARNLRLPQGEAFPESFATGSIFLRTDSNTLYYRSSEGAWVALSGLDGAALADAGAILVSDLGSHAKGTFLVSDGDDGIQTVIPAADDRIPVPKASNANGWTFKSALDLLGLVLTKGQLVTGVNGEDAAQVVDAGPDGQLLVADSTEDAGLVYRSLTTLLAGLLPDLGQLMAGTGGGSVTPIAAPAADGMVLTSRAASVGGAKWSRQDELVALPDVRTRVAGDNFNFLHYV